MGEEKTLSERIKQYRFDKIITQPEFAKLCGLSTQTINSIETGQQEPSLLTRAKILKVLEQED